jgi:hypothetical protein
MDGILTAFTVNSFGNFMFSVLGYPTIADFLSSVQGMIIIGTIVIIFYALLIIHKIQILPHFSSGCVYYCSAGGNSCTYSFGVN